MIDQAYSLAVLPDSFCGLTFVGANTIEENLRYLILLYYLFDAEPTVESLGSLGYLELTETGLPSEGFYIEMASAMDRLLVMVTGGGLERLSWRGTGWQARSLEARTLLLAYEFSEPVGTEGLRAALAELSLTATGDVTAVLTLSAESDPVTHLDAGGTVQMLFRSGATWGLVEDKELTWKKAEGAALDWNGMEALRKG